MNSIDEHVGAPNCGPPISNDPSVYGECLDSNYNSSGVELSDSYGDPCSDYIGNTNWCGRYDTSVFRSMEMCCACGGGQTANEDN